MISDNIYEIAQLKDNDLQKLFTDSVYWHTYSDFEKYISSLQKFVSHVNSFHDIDYDIEFYINQIHNEVKFRETYFKRS